MRLTSLLFIMICFIACAPLFFVPITLSTYQAGKAINEGAAALPYLARSTVGLEEITSKQVNEGLEIKVADTYRWAYGKNLNEVPEDGDTGQKFESMRQATDLLRKVLAGYGFENNNNYVLTSIESAKSEGLILFAVVNREREKFPVESREDAGQIVTISENDSEYFYPYQKDAIGQSLDRVVDWAALTTDCYQQQIHQAMLLTMEANKIIQNQAKQNFWPAKKKWLAGSYMEVFKKQDRLTCAALGIESGRVKPPQ